MLFPTDIEWNDMQWSYVNLAVFRNISGSKVINHRSEKLEPAVVAVLSMYVHVHNNP